MTSLNLQKTQLTTIIQNPGQKFNQETVDQFIAENKENSNIINVDSRHFNNGDYVQLINFEATGLNEQKDITGTLFIKIPFSNLETTRVNQFAIQIKYFTCYQDIVFQLNTDENFYKYFVSYYNKDTNQLQIFVKNIDEFHNGEYIVFTASGTTKDLLGLQSPRVIQIKKNEDGNTYYNNWLNYPLMSNEYKVQFKIYTRNGNDYFKAFTYSLGVNFYNHNDIRREFCQTKQFNVNDNPDLSIIVKTDFEYYDNYMIYHAYITNNTNDSITFYVSYQGQNILNLKGPKTQTYTVYQKAQNQTLYIADMIDLYKKDENNQYTKEINNETPFKPDTNQVVQWQNDQNQNYPYKCSIKLKRAYGPILDSFVYPEDQPLTNFVEYFNQQPISQYLKAERDYSATAFYKIMFQKTDQFTDDIIFENEDNYKFWFQDVDNYKDVQINEQFQNNTGIGQWSGGTIIMQLSNNKDTNQTLTYQRTEAEVPAGEYFSHNDFRRKVCEYGSSGVLQYYVDIDYDTTHTGQLFQTYIQIPLKLGDDFTIDIYLDNGWEDLFDSIKSQFDSSEIYQDEEGRTHYKKRLLCDTQENLNQCLNNQYFKDGFYIVSYPNSMEYLPDTIYVDNQLQGKTYPNNEVKATLKDLLNNITFEYSPNNKSTLEEQITDFNNSDFGRYFQASKIETEDSKFIIQYDLRQDVGPVIIQWDNQKYASNWFMCKNPEYVGNKQILFTISDDLLIPDPDNPQPDPDNPTKPTINKLELDLGDENQYLPVNEQQVYLWSNDIQQSYQVYDSLGNNQYKNGLITVLNDKNNFSFNGNLQPVYFKIQGNAQPITFYMTDKQGNQFTGKSRIQVQFYKKQFIEGL